MLHQTDRSAKWMVSVVGQKNRVLDGRAHWRQLANTVKQLYAEAMSGFATTAEMTFSPLCQPLFLKLISRATVLYVTYQRIATVKTQLVYT